MQKSGEIWSGKWEGGGGGKREGGRGRGGRGNPEQDAAAAGTFTRWVTSPFHPPPPSKPSPRVQTCYCRSRTFHVFTHSLFVDFHSHFQSKSSASPSARFHKYLVNLLYPFGRLPMSLRAFPSCAAARAPLARFLPLPSTFPGRLARLHARLAA